MGLFTKEKKAKIAPRPEESKAGGKWLTDFMKTWGSPGTKVDYPTRDVAGLSSLQQQMQQYLSRYLGKGTEGYNLAMGEARDTIKGNYDPRTSDYWRGFRQEAGDLKTEGVTNIRQRANLGGMLQSSPAQAVESEYGRKFDTALLKELGNLYETERGRKERAGVRAGELGQQQVGNLLSSASLANQPREIEQLRANALYESAIQELLHAYTYQANLASGMMSYNPGTWIKGGGLTDLGFAAATAAGAAGSYFGSKGGGGGSGGGG